MIMNELNLKHFGRFENKKIILDEGINVIYGENESGKSTIHTFLLAMLFGIRRMKGRAAKTDTYTRYTPWENGAWYEGSAVFNCGGKRFRLDRNFAGTQPKASLFCETDGERLSVEEGDLSVLLGNISENTYRNTVFIGQAKSRTEDGLYKEMQEYLSNFQGSGDLRFHPEKALKILKDKKKVWENKEQEAANRKQKAEDEIEYKIQYEQEEIRNLKQKLYELERQMTDRQEGAGTGSSGREEGLKRKIKKEVKQKKRALFLQLGLPILVVFLALTGSAFGKFSWVAALLLTAVLAVTAILFSKKEYHPEMILVVKRDVRDDELLQMRERRKMLLEILAERKTRLENLEEEYLEVRENAEEILAAQREIRCIEKAGNKIREAAERMQNLTDHILKKQMSEILGSITQGKYRQLILEKDFTLLLDTGEKCLQMHQISFGTMEQVYFALRMTCAEILCREEEMPVLLDETFAMYDDKRLFQTLSWLSRRKSQVLLFTCNKREISALEELGIPYRLVKL